MPAWSGVIHWLLLLLLLPALLQAQNGCSHSCNNETSRYYYVRPKESLMTSCPAQPCFTISQLKDYFSECEHNNSCQTANTSLVLLPGTFALNTSNVFDIPRLKFFSLTGYNEHCSNDALNASTIDCNGKWISLMFQHIQCVHVHNCLVFTGHDGNITVENVTFYDSLIRLSSSTVTAADHTEMDYNYTLGSHSYCLLQKQLAGTNGTNQGNSNLTLRNALFSSYYHSICVRNYGIQLTTVYGSVSVLDIADSSFTQKGITHIALHQSTLRTSGRVQFVNANTAIQAHSSNVHLVGTVNFMNNNNSAIQVTGSSSSLVLSGAVGFTKNTARNGGAIEMLGGSLTLDKNARVLFQGNYAQNIGGAIDLFHHVYFTIAGNVEFVNNSAIWGGAVSSDDIVRICESAHVVFKENHADRVAGAIGSDQDITIAGTVQFINNSAYQGGALDCVGNLTIGGSAQVLFQDNHAHRLGGAIITDQYVTIAGTVQFINNRGYQGGAINSDGDVTIADSAQVVFQDNHAEKLGGAVFSLQNVVILTATVEFRNNSAYEGSAINCMANVTITDGAHALFQDNHAGSIGGAIVSGGAIVNVSLQHVTIAGTVSFIHNSAANQGGAIDSDGTVNIVENAHVVFQGNHADRFGGGAIATRQEVNIAGKVQFINNCVKQGGVTRFKGKAYSVDILAIGGAISSHYVDITGTVQFINNSANQGGAVFSKGNIAIAGTVQFISNSANHGGAVASDDNTTIAENSQVIFQDNHADTMGGAIFTRQQVIITNGSQVMFEDNYAEIYGGSILSFEDVIIGAAVQFVNNSALDGGAIASNAILVSDSAEVLVKGNQASDAGGGFLIKNNVSLAGKIQFINNTAQVGGAISMLPGPLNIASNANIIFKGNHAYHVGGAVYSKSSQYHAVALYPRPTCSLTFGINSTIVFFENTARDGGSTFYGITVSRMVCRLVSNNEYDYLNDILIIIPDDRSAVSSDPLRVCICSDEYTPDCLAILPEQNIQNLHYTVYPGQNFSIPAVVVGFNFALTSGSVYAQFLHSNASLGSESQYVQGMNHSSCSQLQYSVMSDKKNEILTLTTNGRQVEDRDQNVRQDIENQNNNLWPLTSPYIFDDRNPRKYYINNKFITNLTDGVFRLAGYVSPRLQSTPVFLSITLNNCPPGFELTTKHRCDCDEKMQLNNLTCNITDQTVNRHGTFWLNTSFSGNKSNGVIIHKHCPFEYCKPEQLNLKLTHPETQCAFDRYGTLCGTCKPGFSLALGSSQCLPHCSNKYLSLLIVFALAGFALVFCIKILNLTVSQGTINGLIFYANIVAANRSIFFPVQQSKFLSFLSVFISWLNLDLGIETCFIKGLDGYWKTWLQFVFPFYLWTIAGVIILVSHYSTHATKFFGNTSVPVLATLFLLSYAKLLRSVITIISFTTLDYPDNSTLKVWSFDGNIQYLNTKHFPLFFFALVIIIVLWLPYTAVLLSAQWLRTKVHHKGLRWLKPFFDAYYGPFKDKYHYWVGVLLLVRGVLFVFFASFFAIENNVNLLLISITSILLCTYTSISGRLYKKMYLTILENTFFLNLGVLGIGTFFNRVVHGHQEALVSVSIGITFFAFVVITIFHGYHFVIIPIQKWYISLKTCNRSVDNRLQLRPLLNSQSSSDSLDYMPGSEAVTHSEVCVSQIQEEAEHSPTLIASSDIQLLSANSATPREELQQNMFNHETPQQDFTKSIEVNQVKLNNDKRYLLNPDTPQPKLPSIELPEAAACSKTPIQSKTAVVSLNEPLHPLPFPEDEDSNGPPRYFAAERDEHFIDFNAPRETLLEYTQYHLAEERNEPLRYSSPEGAHLSAPHESPQESSKPWSSAAARSGPIDYSGLRESLLDYTQ